jgi:hypothetical protein
MKQTRYAAILRALVLIFVLTFAQPAAAHGGEPRLEISTETLNPGSVLEVRGVDFEFEEEVVLTLRGVAHESPLGIASGDSEGSFSLAIALPADLPEGTYFAHAATDDHEVDSPAFMVRGPAVGNTGEDGMREEGDVLLAAMPTVPANFSSTPMLAVQSDAEPAPAPNTLSMLAAALLILGVLVVAGRRVIARR